ncbi:MAG: hypothetical protein IB618_04110 [Candidatus Pacearchaeota archaeon]|nr:MAG: hypothetical protein IB618_04110 [Candidatus Pacearchaeota archaeon]
MMEYTITTIVGIVILILLDYFLKTEVLKFTKGKIIFWVSGIVFLYLIEIIAYGRWWVNFPEQITGITVGFGIPIEEFGCLVLWFLFILIPWQYLKKHMKG